VFVFFFFCLVCLFCYVFSPSLTQYIFHTPKARYSLFVLKVLLNTKPNAQHVWSIMQIDQMHLTL